MKTIAASLLALSLFAGAANAGSVFADIDASAPRAPFDQIRDSAPRSPFDQIQSSAPRSSFDGIQESAPRSGYFTHLGRTAP